MSAPATPTPVFYAQPHPGFTPCVQADPRRLRARKRELQVEVRFARQDCQVPTLEGPVPARVGDAIVSGSAGEQWPIARARFSAKYRPLAGAVDGADGVYLSVPVEVLALPMRCAFTVVLGDGRSRLSGQPGDWLLDYGDGSLGIVQPAIFATTYDLLECA
jgi:hypothetical protein